MAYRLVLGPDDNNTLLITAPAFPELTSFADDRSAVGRVATLALEEAIAARMAAGSDIPAFDADQTLPMTSDWAAPSFQTAIKVALYQSQRDSGTTRAEMARRLGWRREQVDRLFRLDHASRLDQLEAGFAALDKTITPDVRPRIAA